MLTIAVRRPRAYLKALCSIHSGIDNSSYWVLLRSFISMLRLFLANFIQFVDMAFAASRLARYGTDAFFEKQHDIPVAQTVVLRYDFGIVQIRLKAAVSRYNLFQCRSFRDESHGTASLGFSRSGL